MPPAQALKAPEKLEHKTRSLEKRLLLRHFITKALEIRRAEIAAEEARRSEALAQFIRVPAASPKNQTQDLCFHVAQEMRQQRSAEEEDKPKDLLSDEPKDNNVDLIDLSNDTQELSLQVPSSSMQDLYGLGGLLMLQQDLSDLPRKSNSDIDIQRPPSDQISMPKQRPIPLQFARQVQNPANIASAYPSTYQTPESNLPLHLHASKPDGVVIRPPLEQISEPKSADFHQITSQSGNPDSGNTDVDVRSMASGQESEILSSTTAAPSIFSQSSTSSSDSSSSVPSITEVELRERDSKMESLSKRSIHAASPLRPVQRKAIGSISSGTPAQISPDSTSSRFPLRSSLAICEEAEPNPSAIGEAFTGSFRGLAVTELPIRSNSANVVSKLTSVGLATPQDIDKPDAQGFPWVVQVARDGDETKLKRLIVSGADLKAVHTITRRDALCEAAMQGHSKIIEILIQEGSSLDYADADSYTALHHASHKGQLAAAKVLLAAHADVEAPGPQQQTPLHLAMQIPHKNVVMLLLQHNANINARDVNSRTPLHVSAAQGKSDMCNFLLDHGAQVDNRDSSSRTALQLACAEGHYDAAETILCHSNLKPTELTFLTAFFASVENGHIRIAESFFARGLKLKKLRNDSYKPATLAAKSGSPAMLELMIREDCNIKAKDDNDWNALHFAAHHGHWQLIEHLVANDVSVRSTTRTKETPLILAVKGGHFTTSEILLRSKGISVTAEDAYSQHPIHHAVRAGSIEIFNLLISNGAKVSGENTFGWHPIHIAVAYGRVALVERLLEQTAKVEEKLGTSSIKKDQTHRIVDEGYWAEARWPYPGSRPLHLACEYGHYEIASNLISKGAKLEAICSEGWRALHHAAFNGSSALVKLLLEAGCYPWAETDEGHTTRGLGFRTSGTPVLGAEKEEVCVLLGDAMDRTSKPMSSKVALKKGRTVEEKNNLIRAATFSMEMAAKSQRQTIMPRRALAKHPPMIHANSFPSAIASRPTMQHNTLPSSSPLPEKPAPNLSNDPSIDPSSSPRESSLMRPNITALGPSSAITTTMQHSTGPLPRLPLGMNKFKLKRASTFGLDMSKKGIGKVSSYGLDVGKQGIEKISNYGLEVGKQGIEKISSYGLDVGKQGIEQMSSYGLGMSKQGFGKMKKITGTGRVPRKLKAEKSGDKTKIDVSDDQDVISTLDYDPDNLDAQDTQATEGNQGPTSYVDTFNPGCNGSDDDDSQSNKGNDAASISAFTMGGFDTYADDMADDYVGGDDGF